MRVDECSAEIAVVLAERACGWLAECAAQLLDLFDPLQQMSLLASAKPRSCLVRVGLAGYVAPDQVVLRGRLQGSDKRFAKLPFEQLE
jgi:hypothetical protein